MSELVASTPEIQQPHAVVMLGEAMLVGANLEAMPDIAEAANYQGNWMNLQHDRMDSPDFRAKFIRFNTEHGASLKPGEPNDPTDKAESFQSHYAKQLADYDANLKTVNAAIDYLPAMNPVRKQKLGMGSLGMAGIVYQDAETLDGIPLTGRQKDIIAAHETYHGMVDVRGSAYQEVRSGFDWDALNTLIDAGQIKQPEYIRHPDELMARMAQFKNYFGMAGGEQFTAGHLGHIRSHYVQDTGLDNGISTVLSIITPKTEPRFIELMNTLPV